MNGRLVVEMPNGQHQELPLVKPMVTIGRASECDLVLDFPYISRRHARIERSREQYMVVDLGSKNGTFVNGRRIGEMQLLGSGDEISIGDVSMAFHDSRSSEASTAFFAPAAPSSESPIRCDEGSWQVWVRGRLLEGRLSIQEFELLSLLTSRYGTICTRDELGTALWGRGNYDYNLLHRLVHRLKEKLGEYGAWIASVPGRGYKIAAAEPEDDKAEARPASFRTILFTDVEGSSSLTQRLGDSAAREVLRGHEEIIRESLRAHGGSELNTMGDGFMASFDSATRALNCAVAIQKAFEKRNREVEPPVKVRLGLNAGEPIVDREDLFGTAVITAARITDEARGGEVLVTDVVRQLVAGKGFHFIDRGSFVPKGLDDAVQVWQVA